MYNISLFSERAIALGMVQTGRSFTWDLPRLLMQNKVDTTWCLLSFFIQLLFFVATTSLVNVQSTRMNEFLLVLFGSPTHLLLFPSQMGTLSTSGDIMSLLPPPPCTATASRGSSSLNLITQQSFECYIKLVACQRKYHRKNSEWSIIWYFDF